MSDNPSGHQPVRESSHISNIIDQVIQTKKRNRIVRTKKEVILLRSILKVTACNCMDFLITSARFVGPMFGWNCGKQLTVSSDKNWENSAHLNILQFLRKPSRYWRELHREGRSSQLENWPEAKFSIRFVWVENPSGFLL